METLRVDLILAAAVGMVFLVALRGRKMGWGKGSVTGFRKEPLAQFSDRFWGWGDYTPKDWSNAPYKRSYR